MPFFVEKLRWLKHLRLKEFDAGVDVFVHHLVDVDKVDHFAVFSHHLLYKVFSPYTT